MRYGEANHRSGEKKLKEFYSLLLTVPWGEHSMLSRPTQGKHQIGHNTEGKMRTVGKCLYCGFHGETSLP